jgi:hypothetical protein
MTEVLDVSGLSLAELDVLSSALEKTCARLEAAE